MRNICCITSYDGSRYDGWQKQGNTDNTIQGRLEHMFEKMLGEPVEIHGAGRTDAGVHAKGQVFHFHTQSEMGIMEMKCAANAYLPQDISISGMWEMPQRFHSRLNASAKWYRYVIDNGICADVFSRKYTWRIEEPLDIERMRMAAEALSGTHDYKSFCANRRMKKSSVRTIHNIRIIKEQNSCHSGTICLDFYGNGFLYNMVRILTGTLVETGLRKRSPQEMAGILQAQNRDYAGMTAPAQGLFLMEVEYPKEIQCLMKG